MTTQSMTFRQLLGLWLAPLDRAIRRHRLRVELRRLQMHAGYFQWQQDNGTAGLADAHKRIALVRSDLNALR